jgi:hypothetical protein
MAHHHGEVRGPMTYREGDGVDITIPLGPCEVEVTELDVTLTWTDGDTHGAAAIPLGEYTRYVTSGVLKIG